MDTPTLTGAQPGAVDALLVENYLDGIINMKEQKKIMSTMTIERPALVAPAAQDNGAAYAVVLEEKSKGGVGSYLKSVPRRFRSWLQATQKTFRTSAIGQSIGRGSSRLRNALKSIWTRFGGVGMAVSLAGALLTCQKGRDFLRKAAHHTYRVLSAPVRFVGGLIKGLLGNFGWGRKVAASVEKGYNKAVEFTAHKFDQVMTWLDNREGHWLMRWSRRGFQGAVASNIIGYKARGTRKGVQGIVPVRFQTVAGVAHWVFMPTIGTTKPEGSNGYRFQKNVRGLWKDVSNNKDDSFIGSIESGTAYAPDGSTTAVQVYTDAEGDRWVKMDGMLYAADDLPKDLSMSPLESLEAQMTKRVTEAQNLVEHLEAQVAASAGEAPNRKARRDVAKTYGPPKK